MASTNDVSFSVNSNMVRVGGVRCPDARDVMKWCQSAETLTERINRMTDIRKGHTL